MPANTNSKNPFGAESKLSSLAGDLKIFRLNRLAELKLGDIDRLPFSIKVLLESCLRNTDNFEVSEQDVRRLAAWKASAVEAVEFPFKPARVILQDFTGVPCVVDLAAMRAAMKRAGGRPAEDQSARSRGPGDRSLRAGGRFRQSLRPIQQRQERIRAQSRAVRIPQMGPEGVQEFPRRSAGHGYRPPGEPGISGQGGAGAATAWHSPTAWSAPTATPP